MPKLIDYLKGNTKSRLLTDKDLVGFYQVVATMISADEQGNFVYVALGRSPAVLAEFMRQFFHMTVLDLPLGGLSSDVDVRLTLQVRRLLERCIPLDVINGKVVVLIDYAHSGKSLRQAAELVRQYAGERCTVMVAPISSRSHILEQKGSIMGRFDPSTRAAHRLLKVLFTEVDKDLLSPFKSVKYTDLIKSEDAPDPKDIELLGNREALQYVMAAARQVAGEDFRASEHLLARKRLKSKFSYISFSYGYDRSKFEEQDWVNGLRRKSMISYKLEGTLLEYIDQGALDEIEACRSTKEQKRLEDLRMAKVYRRRRIMAGIFVLLFVYGMYWICSTIYHRLSRTERDEL